jgi:hypothetical protein
MDVIVHQAPGETGGAVLPAGGRDQSQIGAPVRVLEEQGLPAIAALKHVMGDIGEYPARRPWHRALQKRDSPSFSSTGAEINKKAEPLLFFNKNGRWTAVRGKEGLSLFFDAGALPKSGALVGSGRCREVAIVGLKLDFPWQGRGNVRPLSRLFPDGPAAPSSLRSSERFVLFWLLGS